MTRRRSKKASYPVRTLDIPAPREDGGPDTLLSAKLGKGAAERAVEKIVEDFGLPRDATFRVSAALALLRLGADPSKIAKTLDWDEFETFCAMAIAAGGYSVRRNVRMRKPTRQIDIVAESPTLVLSIDCKHWRRESGGTGLESQALAQAERTRMLKARSPVAGASYLPVILTMVEHQVKVVDGVPIVPLAALREFLSSVSRFDEGLAFIEPTG